MTDWRVFVCVQGDAIKENAARFLIEISDILNRIPRQMLLILKTNDVLRSIESTLRARASASSFLTMSRCCVTAVAADEMRRCDGRLCRLRVRLSTRWRLGMIWMVELYLWARSSSWGQGLTRLTAPAR
jgi:aarF domain-containing kinase